MKQPVAQATNRSCRRTRRKSRGDISQAKKGAKRERLRRRASQVVHDCPSLNAGEAECYAAFRAMHEPLLYSIGKTVPSVGGPRDRQRKFCSCGLAGVVT